MNDAYRNDLEAALARATDLEREVEALRKRVAELESGDPQTVEARENARRLEAALLRERDELRQHHQWEADDAHWRQASRDEAIAARARNAALKAELTTAPKTRLELQPITKQEMMVAGTFFAGGGITVLIGAFANSGPFGAIGAVLLMIGVAVVVSRK